MSSSALIAMNYLAEQYTKANFPNHRVWNFTFPNDDPTASELRALGMIKMLGSRGDTGTRWVFTDAGQRWAMNHRTDIGLSVSARVLFRKIGEEYRNAGSPPLHQVAWPADSPDEARAFGELRGFDLVEEHTVATWRLTELGRDSIGRV